MLADLKAFNDHHIIPHLVSQGLGSGFWLGAWRHEAAGIPAGISIRHACMGMGMGMGSKGA